MPVSPISHTSGSVQEEINSFLVEMGISPIGLAIQRDCADGLEDWLNLGPFAHQL